MDDLDYIKDKIKITDIAAKAGLRVAKNGFMNCIYHREKTPSMSIKDKENYFKCFGCGKSGTVIDFYMQIYHLQLNDAIKELKALAGLDNNPSINTQHNSPGKNRPANTSLSGLDIARIKECMSNDELYVFDERLGIESDGRSDGLESNGTSEKETELSNKAAIRAVQNFRLEKNKEIFFELYTYCLKHFGNDKGFINYLVNERRIERRLIELFELFFIGDYFQVSNHLKKMFDIGDLQRSGLFNDDGNLVFFKHRIIIPYKYNGEIVYLRGRYFMDDVRGKMENGKYSKYLGLRNDELNLNTPKRFFNVDVVDKLFDGEHLYITEGEFDTIILHQLGFNSIAIAGVGNIPSDKWLQRLTRFEIYLCPDNDEAGKQLENNLVEKFLQFNKEIYTIELPAKDPTEMVRETEIVEV